MAELLLQGSMLLTLLIVIGPRWHIVQQKKGSAMGDDQVLTFEEWLVELDAAGKRDPGALMFYGPSVTESTGTDCWRIYYDDGWTPADALSEDLTNVC